MPRSGGTYTRTDGTLSGSDVFQQEEAGGIDITSAKLDAEAQDMANALSESIARDGQTTITANLPMAGYRHTNVGTSSSRTHYGRTDQVQDGAYVFDTTGGSSNAYTANLSPAITSYAHGMEIVLEASFSNTGAATVNIDGVGAADIKKGPTGAVDLDAGDIPSGKLCKLVYDSGYGFCLLNPEYPVFSGLTDGDVVTVDSDKAVVGKTAQEVVNTITLSTWTPTITGDGSMTVSNETIFEANYVRYGPIIHFEVAAQFDLGGTADNKIFVSIPFTTEAQNTNCSFTCVANENGGGITDPRWKFNGTRIEIFKPGNANFTLGINAAVFIQGFLQA